jgi:hypothetical protein
MADCIEKHVFALLGVILRSGVFAASRRMMFNSVLAAILRGSQELAPHGRTQLR